MSGNININQVEKLEYWNDFPKSKNFDEENSLKADKDTKTRKGISLSIRPNIKRKPYSSGNIKVLGGLSKPVKQGDTDLKNNPLGDNKKIKPIAIVTCGRAIKGDIIIFR